MGGNGGRFAIEISEQLFNNLKSAGNAIEFMDRDNLLKPIFGGNTRYHQERLLDKTDPSDPTDQSDLNAAC